MSSNNIKFDSELPEVFYDIIFYIGKYKFPNKDSQDHVYYSHLQKQVSQSNLIDDPEVISARKETSWIYDPDKTDRVIKKLIYSKK